MSKLRASLLHPELMLLSTWVSDWHLGTSRRASGMATAGGGVTGHCSCSSGASGLMPGGVGSAAAEENRPQVLECSVTT